MRIAEKPLAWIDVETTGLDALEHEIVQIAIIRGDEVFHSFVRPSHPERANDWVRENVTIDMTAPTWADIQPRVIEMLDGTVLAGHNVAFDEMFLLGELRRTGTSPEGHSVTTKVDTVTLAYDRIRDRLDDSLSLDAVSAALGIEQRGAHTAVDDARVAMEVYAALRALPSLG